MNSTTIKFLSILWAAGWLLAGGEVFAEHLNRAVTRVVILGSGTPIPDPSRSGPSVAIVVNDQPYLIDFGPGIIRRAASLSPAWGGAVRGLDVRRFNRAFLTHLHSDHSAGYPDLILTPWVMGRNSPLEVYGPAGLNAMTRHILAAYREDIDYRVHGLEHADPEGWKVNSHEIDEGIVYQDRDVRVIAFRVSHGDWAHALGYRFETRDRTIVISGDTRPSENLVKYAKNADILLHEAYFNKGFERGSESSRNYHSTHHTSTVELARLANRIRPGLLVLYHVLFWGADEQDVLAEIRAGYAGTVAVASDGSMY
ncbi:MAG: MBL fold metallo-hydrolase [Methylococcaceae bacterium]|nr:MBL fold metallo-hydrolase [Methylococcaceae bacterium]